MTTEQSPLGILREIVRVNEEAPDYGMCDQRDNDGEWYQSADLAAWLIEARDCLSRPNPPSPDAGERREAILRILRVNITNFVGEYEECLEGVADAIATLSPAPDADTVMVPRVSDKRIEDLICAWHASNDARPIHEYLGWTFDQYANWVTASQVKPDPLPGFCAENAHNSTGKPGEVQ